MSIHGSYLRASAARTTVIAMFGGGAISVRVRIQKSGKVPQWIDILQMAGPISD